MPMFLFILSFYIAILALTLSLLFNSQIIKKVMKMDAAEPFNVPVNPEALGIPVSKDSTPPHPFVS